MDCCRAVDVSRRGFYAWQRRAPSERDQANAELIVEIQGASGFVGGFRVGFSVNTMR
jgi:hypothetical protein